MADGSEEEQRKTLAQQWKLVKEKPHLVTIALLGLLLMGIGILSAAFIADRYSDKDIDIVRQEDEVEGEIFVDVSGAVIEPGLYHLTGGARINDALVAAGGLAVEADRDWFSKNINLAEKLVDGAKIFVPSQEESQTSGIVAGNQVVEKINVNTATASELDKLWGVGPATAEKIISNRPYGSIEELLSKKALKSNVYERIKDQVRVY